MIKLKRILTEGVNASDLKYQMKMSLEDSGIGAKALIGMKPKGKDYFLKMKSYMYQDSMNKVLKHVNSVLKSKLKVKNFKKTRMGTEFVLGESINEGNKFDDVYKDYGFEVEKKSGGLTYWAHYGSDISGHKNSYIRGELSGWTDGKKAAVGDDRGRQSFSNPKAMAKWFEKNFKMKKESINERTDRFNNVHAESKGELKAAIKKAVDSIAKGKNPKFDIINGRTGEMIGWIEGQEYHWQPHAIASALRELK